MKFNPVMYGFDTETTAADPLKARLLTLSLVRLEKDEITKKKVWVVSPEEEIPEEAAAVNGLTTEWCRENGSTLEEVLSEVVPIMTGILDGGYVLSAYNANYDFTVIESEANRAGINSLRSMIRDEDSLNMIVDPYILGKGIQHFIHKDFRKGQNFKLPSMCQEWGVDFIESHQADADAIGAVKLAKKMLVEESFFKDFNFKKLFDLQVKWKTRQMEGLKKYFLKVNSEAAANIDFGWPFHSSI